jgi:hypothetical protein
MTIQGSSPPGLGAYKYRSRDVSSPTIPTPGRGRREREREREGGRMWDVIKFLANPMCSLTPCILIVPDWHFAAPGAFRHANSPFPSAACNLKSLKRVLICKDLTLSDADITFRVSAITQHDRHRLFRESAINYWCFSDAVFKSIDYYYY